VEAVDAGILGYTEALGLQEDLLGRRIKDEIGDTLLFVEHPAVVTLGRVSEEGAYDVEHFERTGVPVVKTGRGGKNTYHAPGQLVVYPFVDLKKKKKDISRYIDVLEVSCAGALNKLGVPAAGNLKRRGVWVGEEKIAFIGIAVKKWVTYHGISVNINNDIEAFSFMDPCGESDIRVTSAREVLGRELDMIEVKKVFSSELTRGMEEEWT